MSFSQKAQHINELIAWIEDHLTDDLHIDTIAKKSGYSKWHMQRMFKDFTGQTIASYTRKRRLTQSAMALRLTHLSLIDIALRYGFDTQQNFTRMFKHQFSVTPHAFRRAGELNAQAFHSRFQSDYTPQIPMTLVMLEDMTVEGESYQYECNYGEFVNDHASMIAKYQRWFISHYAGQPQDGYILYRYKPSEHKADHHSVQLIGGIQASEHSENSTAVRAVASGGEYLQFSYRGHPDELTRFIISLYYHCLPQMDICRRSGYDLQKVDIAQSSPDLLVCDFFIPVKQTGWQHASKQ